LRRVLRMHDEREDELNDAIEELEITQKKLHELQENLSRAESIIDEKECETHEAIAELVEAQEKLRETQETLNRVLSELLEKEDKVDDVIEEVDRLTDVIIAAGIDPEMIDIMAAESAERGEIED